jgi:hypothetical protein
MSMTSLLATASTAPTQVGPGSVEAAQRPVSADTQDPSVPRAQEGPRQSLDQDIASLDLAPVSFLAVMTEGWDLEKVDSMEIEYKAWLQCVRDFPDQIIVPSQECDRYWHCHILITELYLEQTTRLFGQPLHHYPFSGAMGEADEALQQARFLASRPVVDDLVSRVRSTLLSTSTAQGD